MAHFWPLLVTKDRIRSFTLIKSIKMKTTTANLAHAIFGCVVCTKSNTFSEVSMASLKKVGWWSWQSNVELDFCFETLKTKATANVLGATTVEFLIETEKWPFWYIWCKQDTHAEINIEFQIVELWYLKSVVLLCVHQYLYLYLRSSSKRGLSF